MASKIVPLHTVAGIWYRRVVNCDQKYAGAPYRDDADVKSSMNCIVPWGTWSGAYLLFWEIKKRVQVSEGEVLFFQSRALTHNVSPLAPGGNPNVLDLYSHQAVLDVDRKRRRPQPKSAGLGAGPSAGPSPGPSPTGSGKRGRQ